MCAVIARHSQQIIGSAQIMLNEKVKRNQIAYSQHLVKHIYNVQ